MTEATIDHGDPKKWALLDQEETRCLVVLKKYYVVAEDRTEEDATQRAWNDVKKEIPRLTKFPWFQEVKKCED